MLVDPRSQELSASKEICYPIGVSSLSDKELAQTAAEAGISVGELKEALARRSSGEVAPKEVKLSKAKAHGAVQAQFPMQPSLALSQVHRVFSQQVDYAPVQGKDGQISYVNDRLGLVYRLHGESDGTPHGSVVRVDIDVSQRIKRYRRRILPLLALSAVILFLMGGFPVSSYIVMGAVSLLSVHQTKKQTVKFGEETARAALARAKQAALPGRRY